MQSVANDAWLQISTFLAVAAADVEEEVVDVVVVLLAVVLEGVNDVAEVVSAPALALVVAVAALPPLLFRWLSPTPSPTPNPNARMITNPIIIPQNNATGRPRTRFFFSVKFGCIGAVPLYWLFFACCSLYGGANAAAYCWPGCVASSPPPTTACGRSWPPA